MQNVTVDRDKYIGGSDIPIIMGLSPFKRRFELLEEKCNIKRNEFTGNAYTKYGNVMEPKIREYINELEKLNFVEDKRIDGDMRYHADGYDDDAGLLLEIKTTSEDFDYMKDSKKYIVQLLTGMEMFDVDSGILAVYKRPLDMSEEFDENRLTLYDVRLSEHGAIVKEIHEALDSFRKEWAALRANPFLTETDLLPVVFTDYANAIAVIEEELARYKAIEEQGKQLKSELKAAMIEYGIKTWTTPGGTKITLVSDGQDETVKVFDEKTFKAEEPAVYEKYLVDKVKKGRAGYVRVTVAK